MLKAERLRLTYGRTVALSSATAAVGTGEVVALVGPSGSGKTSLLYCLAGLVQPDSGSVTFDGAELVGLSEARAAAIRRHSFGFVFQFAELVPELTLAENVALPLGLIGGRRRAADFRAAEMLARLGIDDVATHRPDEVSGGQAQRAAVARALVHRPAVVFADEPTGALDTANGQIVLAALLELARDHGSAVVLVSHDEQVAAAADRQVVLRDGSCTDGAQQP
ncbi:MAG TPA: ABC transporter ATP-binding protein [Jatrophihabitantaceae bacterium]|jgi:putative ABC transport system ATP-binding protein|nr:ABC transporter ATP-binding protein [Jatrophihabitantaceae bacterium]